jgi:hypothetical protein
VPWYYRARAAINAATPFLVPTPPRKSAGLSLLNTTCFTASSACGASRTTSRWRRLRCSWPSCVEHTVARLGYPRLLGLAIDWTSFDTTLPSGSRMRHPRSCASPSHARDGPCRFCNWLCNWLTTGTTSRRPRARTSSSRMPCWPWLEHLRGAFVPLSWRIAASIGRASSAGLSVTSSTLRGAPQEG